MGGKQTDASHKIWTDLFSGVHDISAPSANFTEKRELGGGERGVKQCLH